MGLQSIAQDIDVGRKLSIHSDAPAAIGICRRRGLGQVRHLAVADLWVQEKLKTKTFTLSKVPGVDNPSDILTKYVERALFDKHLPTAGLVFMEGRADSAPTIDR